MGSLGGLDLPLFVVDTFAASAFHGAPCPVCILPYGIDLDKETMQKISGEMNMDEVAFLKILSPEDDITTVDHVGIRWFNHYREVELCGHGTIAMAAVLFFTLGNRNKRLTCETSHSGKLTVTHDSANVIGADFPLGICVPKPQTEYDLIMKSLGGLRLDIMDVALCPALRYLLVTLRPGHSRAEFEALQPQMQLLEHGVAGHDVVLLIVSTQGSPDHGYCDTKGRPYDFCSRVFVPFAVREEDPVTGSAHTVLAHYWSQKLDKSNLYARQCSERGGDVSMRVEGERVHITGRAKVIVKGTISI